MDKIGFIGMGNMGYAILNGLVSKFAAEDLIFSCKRQQHKDEVTATTGVSHTEDNLSCAEISKYIVMAVKPQQYEAVITEIKSCMSKDKIVISLAPSFTIAELKLKLGQEVRIIRAMPNTPALLKEGMTGISYDEKEFSNQEKTMIEDIFTSFGKMVKVDENLISTVVCVSGSSPAFMYMMVESLADAGVKYGLKKSEAIVMAAQTMLGSAKMILETGEHPAILKDRVCSPGGTTIAGVAALEEAGFRSAVIKACDACYDKCTRI